VRLPEGIEGLRTLPYSLEAYDETNSQTDHSRPFPAGRDGVVFSPATTESEGDHFAKSEKRNLGARKILFGVAPRTSASDRQTWIAKRDVVQASRFASQRSYQCLAAPSGGQKKLTPIAAIQSALEQPLTRIPASANLSDMMSCMQPLNDLLRPVQHGDSNAFAIMAVPDQMADSFLCQHRDRPETSPDLNPADAKYGAYYLTASRFNYEEEQSPALLLLWTKEDLGWRIVAWAVELP